MRTITITTQKPTSPNTELGVPETVVEPDLLSYFRLNPNDISSTEKKKLQEIQKWVNSQSDDPIQRLQEIRTLRFRLGTPSLGNSEIDHIHKYIRLKQAVAENEAKLETMEQ